MRNALYIEIEDLILLRGFVDCKVEVRKAMAVLERVLKKAEPMGDRKAAHLNSADLIALNNLAMNERIPAVTRMTAQAILEDVNEREKRLADIPFDSPGIKVDAPPADTTTPINLSTDKEGKPKSGLFYMAGQIAALHAELYQLRAELTEESRQRKILEGQLSYHTGEGVIGDIRVLKKSAEAHHRRLDKLEHSTVGEVSQEKTLRQELGTFKETTLSRLCSLEANSRVSASRAELMDLHEILEKLAERLEKLEGDPELRNTLEALAGELVEAKGSYDTMVDFAQDVNRFMATARDRLNDLEYSVYEGGKEDQQ